MSLLRRRGILSVPSGTPTPPPTSPVLADYTTTVAASGTNTLAFPATINSGDLLVIMVATRSANEPTFSDGDWTKRITQQGTEGRIDVWSMTADGTETGTVSITHGLRVIMHMLRITGAASATYGYGLSYGTSSDQVQTGAEGAGANGDLQVMLAAGTNTAIATVSVWPSGGTTLEDNATGGSTSLAGSLGSRVMDGPLSATVADRSVTFDSDTRGRVAGSVFATG